MAWARLCGVEEIPVEGKGKRFEPEGGPAIALFNTVEGLHATEDRCPHADAPLHDGRLHKCIVTCAWHMWQFDVATGDSLMSEHIAVPSYEVKTDGPDVLIHLPD